MNVRILLFPLCLIGLLLASLTGCSSWNKPSSGSFASVILTNTTPEAIRATTLQVFQESEYHLIGTNTNSNPMVFDKEGTHGQSIAYNGVVGTHYGQVVLNRVRVQLFSRSEGNFRLSCQAYIVQDAGSFTGGHEIKLSNMRSGPYQSLLDDIARRINPPEKKK